MKTINVKNETWKRIKKAQVEWIEQSGSNYTMDDVINAWADAYYDICGKE